MRTSMWFCVALVVAIGCSKDDPAKAPGPGSAGSGSAVAPVQPARPPGSLEIFVDDASVAKITPAQIAKWPRLDTLVPEDSRRLGTWQVVYLKGAEAKPVELDKPSATYPEMIPAVFPGEGGLPAFGMFDPVELAKHGKPGLRQDAVSEIRIKVAKGGRGGDHQGGTGGDSDPLKLVLTFKTAAGDKTLTGEKIMAIPRESMPGNEETKGWPLTKLLAAAGVTKYSKLVLIDAAGTSLSIDKKDFDDKTTIPFIKLNRQGSLRFRMMKKQGDGWQATGDLRALSTIKVD
jgi:hypothetical protein